MKALVKQSKDLHSIEADLGSVDKMWHPKVDNDRFRPTGSRNVLQVVVDSVGHGNINLAELYIERKNVAQLQVVTAKLHREVTLPHAIVSRESS